MSSINPDCFKPPAPHLPPTSPTSPGKPGKPPRTTPLKESWLALPVAGASALSLSILYSVFCISVFGTRTAFGTCTVFRGGSLLTKKGKERKGSQSGPTPGVLRAQEKGSHHDDQHAIRVDCVLISGKGLVDRRCVSRRDPRTISAAPVACFFHCSVFWWFVVRSDSLLQLYHGNMNGVR